MVDAPDWELVAKAQSGDMDAFAQLVSRHQKPVIHFCQRMVGSVHDAEDIAQETFVRLHRHLHRLKERAQFSTVVLGIARNLALNFLRDSKRRGRGRGEPLVREDNSERAIPDPSRRPDREARLREIEDLITVGLGRLSPEHREVLVLREVQGLDYSAIARIVKVRQGTVKSRLARAREQLRQQLVELGGELL